MPSRYLGANISVNTTESCSFAEGARFSRINRDVRAEISARHTSACRSPGQLPTPELNVLSRSSELLNVTLI